MANFYAEYPILAVSGGGGGSGTVTSVALTAPASILSVSGSPVTTAGTLALSLTNQTANTVWAGPTTGAAAAPTFRALIANDLALAQANFIVGDSGGLAQAVTMAGDCTLDDTGTVLINTGAITNALVANNAAIAFSKLAALPSAQILVGSAGNVATAVAMSGDVTISNTGVTTVSSYSGTVPINRGGTGQTTQQLAINALAGAVTSGQYLRGNGTNVLMSAIQAADVPTLNQNTTGTAAGLSVTLVPASGGTGVANNNASTITISGNFATTLTVTNTTSVTLPTSGTVPGITPTNHGVVISGAAAAANVTSAGTAGHVLTSNGASADPTFQALPALTAHNARYYSSTTTITGSLATVVYATKSFDTDNAYSAGTYTIAATGIYQINASISVSGTFVLNNVVDMVIQQNGVTVSEYQNRAPGAVGNIMANIADVFSCTAGDTIRVQVSSSGTSPSIFSSDSMNFLSLSIFH